MSISLKVTTGILLLCIVWPSHVTHAQDYHLKTTTFTYNDATNQMKTKHVVTSDGSERYVEYEYAHEQDGSGSRPNYVDMKAANILTPKYSVTVRESGAGAVVSKNWITYAYSSGIATWMPKAKWRWRSGTPGVAPSPATADRIQQFNAYNSDGFPTRVEGARGDETVLQYDSEGQVLSITKSGLTVAYAYNGDGTVRQITDENGHHNCYEYDGLDRLTRVRTVRSSIGDCTTIKPVEEQCSQDDCELAGEVRLEHEYHYHDLAAEDFRADPNYVRTIRHVNQNGETITTTTYYDGLGNEKQTVSDAEDGKLVVTRTDYDDLGRASKSWRPVIITPDL